MLKSAVEPRPRLQIAADAPATLVVAPDLLRIAVVAEIDGLEPAAALRALESALAAFAAAAAQELPGARLVLRALDFTSAAKSAKSRDEAPRITGSLDVPLAADLDFWARARRVTAAHALCRQAVDAAQRQRPPVLAGFGPPAAIVADPERHRPALVERWLAHVGDLAAQARARGLAPALVLERFTAPGAITQRPLSLIEVELQLDLPAVLVPGTAPQT